MVLLKCESLAGSGDFSVERTESLNSYDLSVRAAAVRSLTVSDCCRHSVPQICDLNYSVCNRTFEPGDQLIQPDMSWTSRQAPRVN